MNVIIGVIVDNTMQASQNCNADEDSTAISEKLAQIDSIAKTFMEIDTDGNGEVSIEEVEKAMKEPSIASYLSGLNLPLCMCGEELHAMIDKDGDGLVVATEFVKQLSRIVVQKPDQQIMELKMELHQLERIF